MLGPHAALLYDLRSVSSSHPSPPSGPEPRRRLPLGKKLLFALVPLLGFLLFAELVARCVRGPFHFGSYRQLRVDQVHRGYPAVDDALLGYAPRPDFSSDDNHWGTRVTIDARGLRSNGNPAPVQGKPIVAVGDSFTFGDQVNDDESWPAHLERLLGRPVRNGGVFGYSFAQTVLRAEQLLAQEPAEWLVLSFLPDDLSRCEFSKRYAPVPWFEIVDGRLELRNVPVQDTSHPEEVPQRRFKDLLGHSALLDAIFTLTRKAWWVTDQKERRVHPGGKGNEIGLLLVDRIAAHCRERQCRLLVVLQGEKSLPGADAVLARAAAAGARTLDLVARYQEELRRDPGAKARLFDGHMTSAGNRWVAEQIAAAIREVRPGNEPVPAGFRR